MKSPAYTFKTVMAEFIVLSQVKHPRLIQFVKFYQTTTDWNFVLEYMPSGTLRHILIKYKENCWKYGESDRE